MTSDAGGPGPRDWASPGAAAPPPGWSTEQPAAWTATPWTATGYAPPPAPRPGIIPLRPLGVGELLDGAFTVIRRYPRATLAPAALVMLVVQIVRVVFDYYLIVGVATPASGSTLADSGDYLARATTSALASLAVTELGVLVLTGMVTAVVGEAVLGRPMSAGQAWRTLRPVFGRLLGVSLLTFAIGVGAFLVGLAPGAVVLAAGAHGAGIALMVVGGLAGAVVAAYLTIALSLAPAAAVLEKQPVRAALRRSRLLVRGSWWRVCGILLLASIIASVVSGIISVPFGIAGGGLTGFGSSSALGFGALLLSAVGNLIAGTLVRPFSAGVAAILYIDRRMRAEALDVTLVRAAAQPPA